MLLWSRRHSNDTFARLIQLVTSALLKESKSTLEHSLVGIHFDMR